MFKKNLTRDRASYGKHDQTQYEEGHSFSSARAAGRAMRNTPSATNKMPTQRRYESASPKKSHRPSATLIWFMAARLWATISGTDLSAYSHEKRDPIIEKIPNQIQKEKKLETVYQGDTNCVSTPILRKICDAAVNIMLISS